MNIKVNMADIPDTFGDDIRTAILDLDGLRTPKNRHIITWVQWILTTCATMIGEPCFKVKQRRNEKTENVVDANP